MQTLDWVVVSVYLGLVVLLGILVGRKDDNPEEYFLGGHRIPWWAALLSMVATEISAATFLGAPEQGYTRDLTYLQFGIGSILARFVLAFLFIGVFYKLRVYTVYGFLSKRFGQATGTTAAGMFLVGRVFAGGSRLFIASLAIKVATGLALSHSILILGVLAIVYTMFGGIKAVIWTDVLQAIVLIGGGILSIWCLLSDIPISGSKIIESLSALGKFRFFDLQWRDAQGNLALLSNAYHMLPAILGGFFLTLATHGTDQAMVQRLLTCKNSGSGRLSLVLSGFLGIFVTCLFMAVGMLLYVFVLTLPDTAPMARVAAELGEAGHHGHFYLHYIIHGLPVGLSGLIIAAVLAAAMSSIDSELNAMSATFINDFYLPHFDPQAKAAKCMRYARYATVVSGCAIVGLGLCISDFYLANPNTDLLSIALGVMTFFYGGLLGVFLLGLLTTRRGSTATTVSAIVVSTLFLGCFSYRKPILEALGLVAKGGSGHGYWNALYGLEIAWPWFTIIGTLLAVLIALAGRSRSNQLAETKAK